MEFIVEKQKKLPIAWKGDVIVVGSGPAGVGAAICAARQGASVLLVEQTGEVGGTATSGLMSHWTGSTQGGIYEEILDHSDDSNGHERSIINPEKLKTVLLEMLIHAGVKIRLYTFVGESILSGDCIRGVVGTSKNGREAFLSHITIDCTGDGDIAADAGVPYIKGDGKGGMQPSTLMFKVAGVDTSKAVLPGSFEETCRVPMGEIQTLGRAFLPKPCGHVLLYKSTLPGVVTCNMTNCVDVDGTNPDDLVHATLVCREQLNPIINFLKKYAPGFKHCYLISTASVIGIRETRHFRGIKTLTENDIAQARIFDDWVVTKAHFNFDIHNLKGSGLDPNGAQKNFTQKKAYTIPYGCLIPVNRNNLLLAGRNISATHKASSSCRAMPICANIGQAAGIAAALCAQLKVSPHQLNVLTLQKELNQNGVTLD